MEIRFTPVTSSLLFLALVGVFLVMGFPLAIGMLLSLAVVLFLGYAFSTQKLTDIDANKNKVVCSNCRYDNKKGRFVCKNCKVRL